MSLFRRQRGGEQQEDSALARKRHEMVATQIASRDVRDKRVLTAMRAIPRHLFVPGGSQGSAYGDHPVPIGEGQTISQPYIVALMTQLLALKPDDRVLEIGTGSGYQAAILAELAGSVVTIERHAALAGQARQRLHALGYEKVDVVVGDGTLGWPAKAPYDAIIVTAAGPEVPEPLREQLAIGGRLVCPAGRRDVQTLTKVTRTQRGFREESGISCIFVPLIGEAGWPDKGGSG